MSASLGYWGSNIARGGFLAASAGDLPVSDYVERLVAPYFAYAAEWYETIGIGVTGGELFKVKRRWLADPFFGVHLNPGHFIHLDEWPSSPVYEGSSGKPEVLPLSNLAGYLPPLWLSPQLAMRRA